MIVRLVLIVLCSYMLLADYATVTIKKGWNAVSTSFGYSDLGVVDPACVLYYAKLTDGVFYRARYLANAKITVAPHEGILLYTAKNSCMINIPTTKSVQMPTATIQGNVQGEASEGEAGLDAGSSGSTGGGMPRSIQYRQVGESIALKSGWNFVGSSFAVSNPSLIDTSCVSQIKKLQNGYFRRYDALGAFAGFSTQAGEAFAIKANQACSVQLPVSPNLAQAQLTKSQSDFMSGYAFNHAPSPKPIRFGDLEDAKGYFDRNCLMCHNMTDTRLKRTSLEIQNGMNAFMQFKRKDRPMMTKYLATLNDKDVKMLAQYIELLYSGKYVPPKRIPQ